MPNTTCRAVALAALAAAIIAAVVALDLSSATAQSDDEQSGRIVARRLDDGRTEFGWQPVGRGRILPTGRFFPADVGHQRWLRSTPVEVDGEAIGRINARLSEDGRIEFAFTSTDGERIAPSARYFPRDARVGRWLRSTEIAISAAPATGFVAVSADFFYACAIRAGSGVIECWGDNDYGKSNPPAGSFSTVSAGNGHTCGLRESGAIECWGDNYYGQADPPAGSFSAVSTGRWYTCGLRESGAIECWGNNDVGQTDAPAGSFSAVSVGDNHVCAIRAGSGEITCWGSNDSGQADPPAGSFSAVSASSGILEGRRTCAIRESGEITCWGNKNNGAADAPAGNFSAVSVGSAHACAIRAGSGEITCWGSNWDGESNPPAGSFSAVNAGSGTLGMNEERLPSGYHTCAIREGGAIECWGNNYYGQSTPPAP